MGFDTPGGGGGAPTDGPYLTSGSDPDLSNETVVTSPENVPDWTEDGNSPITFAGATSKQTFNLNQSADAIEIIVLSSGGNDTLELQVNGDTNANYDFISVGGTQTLGADGFGNVVRATSAPGARIGLSGRFDGRLGAWAVRGGASTGGFSQGRNTNVSSPISSISFTPENANSVDLTARVYGLD